MIGCSTAFLALGLAVASALWGWSFAWVIFVAVISGAFILASGSSYGMVIKANERGSLTYFPLMWAFSTLPVLAASWITFWIVKTLFAPN